MSATVDAFVRSIEYTNASWFTKISTAASAISRESRHETRKVRSRDHVNAQKSAVAAKYRDVAYASGFQPCVSR